MGGIEKVFSNLDRWRALPDYQLERRADVFFSLYLPEVLESCLGRPFRPFVVPEFPIKKDGNNRSDKVDYLALSADFQRLVLVELKTDSGSTRTEQFKYLRRAAGMSGADLLGDIQTIRQASQSENKYDALLGELWTAGLTEDRARKIRGPHDVVLIAPHAEFPKKAGVAEEFAEEQIPLRIVSFENVRQVVLRHQDPVSQRFAESLKMWAENPV